MRLLTLVEVARLLGICYSTAHKIRRDLPGVVWLGSRRRWREDDIKRFIDGGGLQNHPTSSTRGPSAGPIGQCADTGALACL
jgi:predicted DNA-binding transcriptional regulator AlpA